MLPLHDSRLVMAGEQFDDAQKQLSCSAKALPQRGNPDACAQ
jgi:hypothetical protein